MSVTCALFGPLREDAGRKHIELDIETPTTVEEVLSHLIEECPALAASLDDVDPDSIAITVDGTNVKQLHDLETTVEADMVVRFTPPIVGGRR